MVIADNVLKQRLQNVFFIWGSGKTTIANVLAEKYGCYVYHTDQERGKFFHMAQPEFQPAMCRDVPDYWALEPEDARNWETDIVREFTPMVVADLLVLSARHPRVICEGDLDIAQMLAVAAHAVLLSNHGRGYDFFDRPEQKHMLEDILNRTDLTEEEKARRVQNAYEIVGGGKPDVLRETPHGVKEIVWDEQTPVEKTAERVAAYFGF